MITLTADLEKCLFNIPLEVRSVILRRAWDVCCDGATLELHGITDDLWDGEHEDEKESFEMDMVIDALSNYLEENV